MSQIPGGVLRVALGQEHIDRRAELRRSGWDAVPAARLVLAIDAAGEVALRDSDRSASPRPPARLALAPAGEPRVDADLFLGVDSTGTAIVGRMLGDGDGDGNSDGDASVNAPSDGDATVSANATINAHADASVQADTIVHAETIVHADTILHADADVHADAEARVRVDRDPPGKRTWGNLRTIGLRLDDEQRAIVTELVALAAWHRSHPHCPRCGSPTRIGGLGWWRTCPVDGTEHYPRTDPAIIVLLRDDEDNALLGRQTRWPPGAFSTLAGFVEAGESAEAAIVREVHEEVGLEVASSSYLGSQPWPFPASLMLGYHARVAGVRPPPHVDGEEIAEARWLARDELRALAASRAVRLPGRLSIAHHLVARWYGQPIPDDWCRW